MKIFNKTFILTSSLLLTGLVQAQIYETEWIHSNEGHQEQSLGMTLQSIEVMEEEGLHKVTLEIPKGVYANIEGVEEVLVTGKAPEPIKEEPKVKQKVRTEFVKDYDNDYYGLIIYLDKKQNWPVRLYFDAEQ